MPLCDHATNFTFATYSADGWFWLYAFGPHDSTDASFTRSGNKFYFHHDNATALGGTVVVGPMPYPSAGTVLRVFHGTGEARITMDQPNGWKYANSCSNAKGRGMVKAALCSLHIYDECVFELHVDAGKAKLWAIGPHSSATGKLRFSGSDPSKKTVYFRFEHTGTGTADGGSVSTPAFDHPFTSPYKVKIVHGDGTTSITMDQPNGAHILKPNGC